MRGVTETGDKHQLGDDTGDLRRSWTRSLAQVFGGFQKFKSSRRRIVLRSSTEDATVDRQLMCGTAAGMRVITSPYFCASFKIHK